MFSKQRLVTGCLLAALICVFASSGALGKRKPPPAPPVSFDMTLLPEALDTVTAMTKWGDIVGGQFFYPATATTDDDLVDVAVLIVAELIATGELEGQVVETRVSDINDSLQILGTYVDEVSSDGVPVERTGYAFVGTLNATLDGFADFTLLPAEITIGNTTYSCGLSPAAINSSGHVTGTASVAALGEHGENHAFAWTGGPTVVDLIPHDMPGVYDARAVDINDAGQILGRFRVEDAVIAFRMTPGGDDYIELGDMRKRPKNHPSSLNQHGEATGACQGPYYYDRAYFYSDDGGIENLGTLYNSRYSVSTASSINSEGHIVGRSGEFHDWTDPRSGGYLYTRSLGMVNLATLIANPPEGMVSQSLTPNCVIDPPELQGHGKIAGTVQIIGSEVPYRSFLLTPAN